MKAETDLLVRDPILAEVLRRLVAAGRARASWATQPGRRAR